MNGEQVTMTEIATLLLDLMLTMVLYGALPMIFAGGRNKAIKDRKYKLICYAINFPVMLVLQRGGSVNLIPYVFWTFIFSRIGMRILSNRGVPAVASENAESLGENVEAIANKTEKITSRVSMDTPPRKEITSNEISAEATEMSNAVCPCCGFELFEGSAFCSHCGESVKTTEFNIEDRVLKKYTDSGGNVVIPRRVTMIGNLAFCGCKEITSVVIPDGVTEIKDEAFPTCYSLTSIKIPASVTSIGEGVFDECYELTIHAPKGSCAAHYAADNGINYVAE